MAPELEEAGLSLDPTEGQSPVDTWILDFKPPERNHKFVF